jgi:hypothetical protein
MHVDLDERAGKLLRLVGRGRFARAQAHDDVLPPYRLARAQGDVLDDAVALVEDSEDRDALRHGRDPALPGRRCRRIYRCTRRRRILLLLAAAARGQRQRNQQRCRKSLHAYSGIHGS